MVTITDLIRVALRGYKIICSVFVAGILAGLVALALLPTVYESTALVYIEPRLSVAPTENEVVAAQEYAAYRTITYKELVTTDLILQQVIDDLNLDESPGELAGHVTALAALNTSIIEVIVAADDPERAALTANTIAKVMVSEFSESDSAPGITIEVRQVQVAVEAVGPASPRPGVILGLSALSGLLVGFAIVLAMHAWRIPSVVVEQTKRAGQRATP